ncbi:MAG: uracil-DNA glycosylase [Rhodobacteraceae bacterium]|nr:uracil-DNA glycosylase [Paracoccaceae bacterium]
MPEIDFAIARAMLEWQMELGADEAMLDAPLNRYEVREPAPAKAVAAPTVPVAADEAPLAAPPAPAIDPIAEAEALAAGAQDLAALAEAMAAFERCELKRGARNFVFADGIAGARVLILGEAPGREEDIEGRPFVGAAGHLLDRMLAAIGLSRSAPDPAAAVYITNVLPWRPPGNREPEPEEIAMFRPFIARHIELVAPDVVVLMGNPACMAALGQRGVMRLRGHWAQAFGRPALPMAHPAHLLRNPAAKREAWADLLALRARLDG